MKQNNDWRGGFINDFVEEVVCPCSFENPQKYKNGKLKIKKILQQTITNLLKEQFNRVKNEVIGEDEKYDETMRYRNGVDKWGDTYAGELMHHTDLRNRRRQEQRQKLEKISKEYGGKS